MSPMSAPALATVRRRALSALVALVALVLAGTATILETARALTTGPRPRNDVVLVFTDGEEACLCGARAFVDQHPLARGGGVVLNLEARGSSGPAILFETSADNAGLVDLYGRTPHPVGTSF